MAEKCADNAEPPVKMQKTNGEKLQKEAGNAPTFSEKPTFEDFRQLLAAFAAERDWDKYHAPRNLLLQLVSEVGELAEVFQWKGEVAEGLPDWSSSDREKLEHELGDVLIDLIRLADKCHVNLPEVALQKIELNRKKYPAEKVYGSCKKYNEYE